MAAVRKYEAALEVYERAADRGRYLAATYRRIGALHMAFRHPERAIPPLRRAAKLERNRPDDWVKLGDACRAAGDDCAEDAYVHALAAGTSPAAARALEELGHDPFARGYDYAPHMHDADDFHPAETRGAALALGVGERYAGLGLQLSYYLLQPEHRFALAPYVSFGVRPNRFGANPALFFGVAALYGEHDRWLLDGGFGPVSSESFYLYGERVAYRTLYGLSLSAGREWMWSTGISLRALVGFGYVSESARYDDDRFTLALSLGLGWKPW